jgi:hypothetical protein
MTAKIVENERTAMAQKVTTQPDGPGHSGSSNLILEH